MSLFAQTDTNLDFTTSADLTTSSEASGGGIGATLIAIYLVVWLVYIVSLAKIYVKAGRSWWEGIVPIYNIYVLQQIVGRPGWWVLLYFVPFVNIVIAIVNANDLSKAFGKGLGTTLGLLFLPFIMYPVVAFGSSYRFQGASAASVPGQSPAAGAPGAGGDAQATTSVPAASVAVGGGVGAAQPGEAISQTNPVPEGQPVNSPPQQPQVVSPQSEANPAPPPAAPAVEETAPSSEEVTPPPEESPATPPQEPAIPSPEQPNEPVQPPSEDQNQTPGI